MAEQQRFRHCILCCKLICENQALRCLEGCNSIYCSEKCVESDKGRHAELCAALKKNPVSEEENVIFGWLKRNPILHEKVKSLMRLVVECKSPDAVIMIDRKEKDATMVSAEMALKIWKIVDFPFGIALYKQRKPGEFVVSVDDERDVTLCGLLSIE